MDQEKGVYGKDYPASSINCFGMSSCASGFSFHFVDEIPYFGYQWPGNVRKLEQAVRQILLTHNYNGGPPVGESNLGDELIRNIQSGTIESKEFIEQYCILLYKKLGTYQKVARRTGLDPRTIKKYLMNGIDG
jgi:transcriptional regulator with PAS, ATPase and Fis domain